ncbi:MAG: sel1 repeat family protein [Proteobacteria bacterium]|nr:sel1 repeat family protein [Pseudomonadota bacterium]
MKCIALAVALVVSLAAPAWAGLDEELAAAGKLAAAALAAAAKRGDYDTAFRGFKSAAEQGDAGAQFSLGFMYTTGQGVPQDYAEAVKWYRRAAEQGLAHAQLMLVVMYNEGQGVPQDYAEAAKWARLAAEQGHAYAQFSLGDMYGEGQGIPQDYVQAHLWYNLAAAQGIDTARKYRDIIAEKMTPAQIAEAQRLAREWKPKKE